MKLFFTLIFIRLLIADGFSQTKKTFSLGDTIIHPGQWHRLNLYKADHSGLIMRYYPETIDSVFRFMKNNSSIKIEIAAHGDSRYKAQDQTQQLAKSIADSLILKGVAAERLIAVGYGSSRLLVSDEQIKKARTIEEQEALHSLNRRVEIKIVGVDNKK